MSPSNPILVTPEETLLSQNIPESILPSVPPDLEYLYELFLETLSDPGPAQEITPNPSLTLHDVPGLSSIPSQIVIPVEDTQIICAICSVPISLPPPMPPPQAATFPPPNWFKIPQELYGHGKKQWDFTPSGSISFSVNGFPGVNIGDALHNKFTGLDGRDDLMLQDANSAISCRLSVRLPR